MEHKIFESEVKEADDSALAVTHWISTTERDRQGDIMIAAGMVTRGLPVVLWAHGRDAAVGSEPIARPLWIKAATYKNKTGLMAKTQFFDDAQGRRYFEKVKQGFLHSWSIGFLPLRSEPLEGGGRRILEFDLLEYSLCAVPANAGATTLENVEGLAFKILGDGETCDCPSPCKGDPKCGGHRDRRKLQFVFVDSRPPQADTAAIAAVARKVVQEEIQRRADKLMGKVN